jgi:opacity protein-like surface antigen
MRLPRRRIHIPVAMMLLVLAASPAAAEDTAVPDVLLTLGGRLALITGDTRFSVAAGSGTPNVLSELRWRGLDTVVPEVNAELVWKRLVALGTIGAGAVFDGVLIDDDFAGNDRTGRFSHTRSSVVGALVYVNLAVGFRLVTWGERATPRAGYVDAFIGHQYWREDYDAFGATGTVSIPNDVRAISETFTFNSLRIGARAHVPVFRAFGLKIAGAILPWSHVELEDEHPLRTDLRHDPSFSAHADGGFGYQLDGGFTYNVGKHLSVETGFRYFRLDSGRGQETAHTVAGDVRQRLNEIVIERYGPYVGVSYRF